MDTRLTKLGKAGTLAALGTILAAGALPGGSASAQEVLPKPKPPFKEKIGRTYKDSQPDKIPVTKALSGAPSVRVVLIDDVGNGAWSTFGAAGGEA
jgi:hypothetical protein